MTRATEEVWAEAEAWVDKAVWLEEEEWRRMDLCQQESDMLNGKHVRSRGIATHKGPQGLTSPKRGAELRTRGTYERPPRSDAPLIVSTPNLEIDREGGESYLSECMSPLTTSSLCSDGIEVTELEGLTDGALLCTSPSILSASTSPFSTPK